MTIAFFGLLYMQITYLQISLNSRANSFDEFVKRSLYQVSKNLELDQTKKYFNQSFQDWLLEQKNGAKSYRNTLSAKELQEEKIIHSRHYKITAPDGYELNMEYHESTTSTVQPPNTSVIKPPTQKGRNNAILRTIFDMQEEEKRRYLHEFDNINDVISQILNQSSTIPIEERINMKLLGNMLRDELKYNGIELPFKFEIVDKNNKPLISGQNLQPEDKKNAPYSQILFPNDQANKLSYLKVYFPTKEEYLYSEVSFLMPAILFTVILLFTFIIMIFIIFRQKRLSEMKNDFMNNMTHELKTPVSTISLAAQMLKDASVSKSPEIFKHISGVINDETERLSFQVEKVLQMSLFENQKTTLKFKELDANDIVVHVANTFQLKVEKFGGHLDIDLEATESTINADKMHFTNVLFNLLDNAVKYRREDVPLELMIRTWNSNNKLYVSVEDNGIGIKKDDSKRVFDRFYRVHTGNRHDVKGFGLGLAYVRKIIEDHKGTIKIDSELGKYTKFIICLPIVE